MKALPLMSAALGMLLLPDKVLTRSVLIWPMCLISMSVVPFT